MKRAVVSIMAAAAVTALLLAGCDWTTGGDNDFNTSRGAGINVNFSGVYRGRLSGGKAVSQTSNGNITQFTITQAGNTIEVIDNQGSHYRGTVGAPGAVAEPVNGVYPAGAELVQAQVSFSGKDEVAAKHIDFVGVIHVVAVQDITGSASTQAVVEATTNVYTEVDNGSTNIVTVIVTPLPGGGSQTVTITTDASTGEEIGRVVERSDSSVDYRVYEITEANSQYVLEGTWVEEGGVVAQVSAISPGTAGVISSGGSSESSSE